MRSFGRKLRCASFNGALADFSKRNPAPQNWGFKHDLLLFIIAYSNQQKGDAMYARILLPLSIVTCLAFSSSTSAGPNGMSEADMQRMMKQAEAAQACYEKLDESKLNAMQAKGKKMKQEIDALCKAGKEQAANKKALTYSMQIRNDPQFKLIQACGKKMRGIMPQPYLPVKKNDKKASVCAK